MSLSNQQVVREHFDLIARDYDKWKRKNAYYYNSIKSYLKKAVRPGTKVLEIGCATGEILASVKPSLGVGIDISPEMIVLAKKKFPQYSFLCSAIEDLAHDEKFDYIIMVDLIDHVYDIISLFKNINKFCSADTKIILTTINPWWEPVLKIGEKIGAKMPEGPHNFIEKRNLSKIIEFLDFSISYSGYLLLFPKFIPILSFLANTIGTKILGVNKLSFVQYMVLKASVGDKSNLGLGCSVVIPCYNEAANIEEAVRRIPKMGKQTEIIIVNDGSTDDTAGIVRSLQKDIPEIRFIDYFSNKGKGYALKQGFDAATQEVLMILDADMSTPPEELPYFFALLDNGRYGFVNGTRMVYPMQDKAMPFLNRLGNNFFGLLMTFIIGQHLTDTLCGTKALYRKDYKYIKMGLDEWGDFDLLFGAAKLGRKIVEIPIHYMERRKGESKMRRFQHGLHLLKAVLKGFKDLVLKR